MNTFCFLLSPRAIAAGRWGALAMFLVATWLQPAATQAADSPRRSGNQAKIDAVINNGLDWLASRQSRIGHWQDDANRFPVAMTALAATALVAEGSTTTQGKYSKNIRRAVDYLISRSNPNGLIGDAKADNHYTYGHGFSMLFLSQVLGEEEDEQRRKELIDVLTRAVQFTGNAQTPAGGWGYVSAKDGNNFDEGSTTITQVQGLRGCRNAGIPVPAEMIDKAIKYIYSCTTPEGGVQYNTRGGPGRPAITAASIACLFNAGDYDSDYVPRMMEFSKQHLGNINNQTFGHWHYAHYYYAQVMYRQGGKDWDEYYDIVANKILSEVTDDGKHAFWAQGSYGPVYVTANNLTILQLNKAMLPIYQR